jgi:crotonobetainyl-CoA:carnitine CoA-transferase CaiB-like acyl-CoA transferase
VSGAAGAGASSTGAARHRADFLEGVRVLELGDGVAGAAATSFLWALGADVTTAVDPRSVHRRGRPAVEGDEGPVSLLAVELDRGKRRVAVSDFGDLAALEARLADHTYDLVVADRVGGATGPLAALLTAAEHGAWVARTNRAAWVTISAFGLTGPRCDDVATELTLGAAAGLVASVRDPRTGAPMKLGGLQSLFNSGQVSALACCQALDLAADGPVHLDVSAQEAVVATGPVLDLVALFFQTGTLGGAQRYGAPASFYPCTDGLIRISAMEDHQWRGVVAAMGNPDWAERFATVESRIEGAAAINDRVAAWAATMPKESAESTLQAHGVPATAMYSPAELLASPQLLHREAFDPLPLADGRETVAVAPPFRVVAGGNDDDGGAGERRRRGLRGLRVLEAGHVLAVPLAGALLGALGARVTKLEDLGRLDMYRRNGPYIDREPGLDRTAYFAFANHSKANAVLRVEEEPDRLVKLLDDADVFLENLGAKRARTLGVAASLALDAHPGVLAISSTGFGQDGPYASYRAYAYNMHAAAALGYLTRNAAGESADIDLAWGDLVSAYAVATIVAAWAVGPRGNRGAGLDYAMADAIVSHFPEFLAAASLDPANDASVDRANEVSPYAPSGVYPAGDGWVALTVDGDEQFAALTAVLDAASLRAPEFTTGDSRFGGRRELDARIAAVTPAWEPDALAGALRSAGVPAEPVGGAVALIADEHLTARGFFPEVEHPLWGRRRLIGVPWRPYGAGAAPLGPPPMLSGMSDAGAEA